MKKIIFLIGAIAFVWFIGFAAGSKGWCLAFKRVPGFAYTYTNLDRTNLAKGYDFMVVGYDARNELLLSWKAIN